MTMTTTESGTYTQHLRDVIRSGERLLVIVTSVSKNGLRRTMRVVGVIDGAPADITVAVANAIDARIDERDGGLIVKGVGMDMRLKVIADLGRAVHQDDQAYKLA